MSPALTTPRPVRARHAAPAVALLSGSLSLALLAAACTGAIGGGTGAASGAAGQTGGAANSGSAGGSGSAGRAGGSGTAGSVAMSLPPPPSAVPDPDPCTSQSAGPRMVRRLTAPQFRDSLRDLFFRDAALPTLTVFSDPVVLGFSGDASALLVQGLNAQQLADYAETVAHWAVTTHLSQLSTCTTTDAACRQSFIRSFGRRAFREPLPDARVKTYEALFALESTFADGAEAVVTAMLQSPFFLYRRELGATTGTTVKLTPYEVASSLSYLLTGSMPDDPLLAAADAGQLATPQQLDQQVTRLLQDPRAPDALMGFMSGWLGLERVNTVVKDDTVFKPSATLKASMLGETRAFLLDAFNRNLPVSQLFTADYSFFNQELAQFYGIYPSDGTQLSATDFGKVTLRAGQRNPGLLAQASVLTGYSDAAISSPVLRGKLVRTRLLCQSIPPPPADVDTKLKPSTQAQTTRQHFEQHTTAGSACKTCHTLMDPIGYGFEHYDAFGRWRDQENGLPIDATGTVRGAAGGDLAFDGLTALSTYLSTNDDVKQCLVRYWSYFAYGAVSWSQDACTFDAIRGGAGAYGLRDVLTAIVHAPHFTQRQGDAP
jgi:hypothetical protein